MWLCSKWGLLQTRLLGNRKAPQVHVGLVTCLPPAGPPGRLPAYHLCSGWGCAIQRSLAWAAALLQAWQRLKMWKRRAAEEEARRRGEFAQPVGEGGALEVDKQPLESWSAPGRSGAVAARPQCCGSSCAQSLLESGRALPVVPDHPADMELCSN
jgi:hypothetical protein